MRWFIALAALLAGPAGAQTLLTVEDTPTPLALDAAALIALPRAVASQTIHDKTARCEGVWLTDILARAGVPQGEALRGDGLRKAVIATASDGYRVAFTLGELDRTFGAAKVLVADRCDGAALGGAGPLRLIVAGDARGGRALRNLLSIRLLALP